MSDEENKVSEELFKDVKFYVVGDIDQKVVQLLKAGKGKEVSYNALATHIIAEDGDNPEVSESREVFDLPVVKPSWVILSVRCGDLLPVTGFSPESGQIFFGVNACLPRIPEDLNTLWAYVTFYGGSCQLNLNRKVTHLVVKEPKGAKYECALKHPSIRIVTPDWITDSVKDKSRKEESLYHPRLTYIEPEEQSEEESDLSSRRSPGSSSSESSPRRRPGPKKFNSVSPPPRKPERRLERMFDDSDDDSPNEKEGPNLNWTPAEVTPGLGTARRRAGAPGTREPTSTAAAAGGGGAGASGMINLCASVPVHAPGAGAVPEGRPAATPMNQAPPPGAIPGGPEAMPGWSPAARTLRNITNSSERPGPMVHPKLSGQPLPGDHPQPHPPVPQQQFTPQGTHPQHLPLHLQNQHHMMQLHHHQQQQQLQQQQQQLQQQQQQQQQVAGQVQVQGPVQVPGPVQVQVQGGQGFPHPMSQQQRPMSQQHPHQMAQAPQLPLSQQRFMQHPQLRPQHPLHQLQQQQRMHMLQQQHLQNQQTHLQNQQQNQQQTPAHHPQPHPHPQQQQQQQQPGQTHLHPHHLQQSHFLHQTQHLHNQHQSLQVLQQPQGAPLSTQLYGHEPGQEVPPDGFLVGCVFAIADYPEQMADKQLLATWKRVIQACGGVADNTLTSRCTHLLCESQVSNMYVQALREGKRCVTAHWLNTVLKKKKMVPPSRTLHLPFAFPPGAKPCSQHIISVTGFVDSDRDDLKLMAYLAGARYTGYLCRSNTVLICKEPSGLKYEKAKEWKIPCVNAQWLCDVLLGNFEALRQIQHSRYQNYNHPEPLAPNPQLVINLLGAWRVPIKVTPEALANLQLQKQKLNSNSEPANKKARLDEVQSPGQKLPPESTPLVMFTGFEPALVQQYTKWVHALGGEVADSGHRVTHLLASKVSRTVKFLTAMSVVKHIVRPEWLEESWRSQKFVDEQSFTLRDAEAEVLFSFSLEESLKRAQSSQLFKGKYFYLTPGMCPSLSTMKAILESAGGKLLPKLPSSKKVLEHRQNKNLPEIILISCDNDLHLLRDYFLKNIDVHNAEFILSGVLTQKIDYDSYKFT